MLLHSTLARPYSEAKNVCSPVCLPCCKRPCLQIHMCILLSITCMRTLPVASRCSRALSILNHTCGQRASICGWRPLKASIIKKATNKASCKAKQGAAWQHAARIGLQVLEGIQEGFKDGCRAFRPGHSQSLHTHFLLAWQAINTDKQAGMHRLRMPHRNY